MPHCALVRRTLVGVLAGALAVSGSALVAATSPASAAEGFVLKRLSGSDRYGTAAAIATEAFGGGAPSAVIARGDGFADALAANYLAGVLRAPVLLTATDELPVVTADALAALGVDSVHIVGGDAAVSAGVEDELADRYTVVRHGSSDRYLTAQLIAEEAADRAGSTGAFQGVTTALLASGQDFPDALALGPISYARGFPLLLTRPGDLPASTRATLRDLGVERVVIAGQTTAVSQAVEDDVEGITGNAVIRLGGRTRFETATAIATFAYDELDFDDTHVVLARGDSPRGFADALTGGAVAGKELAPILLTDPMALASATETLLEQRSGTLTGGHLLGGPSAVSSEVKRAAEAAAQGPGSVAPLPPASPSATPSVSASPSASPSSGSSVGSTSGTTTGSTGDSAPSASPSDEPLVPADAQPASVVDAQAVDEDGGDHVVVIFDESVQGVGTYTVNGGDQAFEYQVQSGAGTNRLLLGPISEGADFDAADGTAHALQVTGELDLAGNSTTVTRAIDETGTAAEWIEAGETRVRNVDSGQLFTTLQEAVDAEETEDAHTLQAFSAAGESFEEVVTITKDLTVEGVGDGDGSDDRTDLAGSFIIAADGVTVRGFDITDFGLVRDEGRPAAVQVVDGSAGFLIDDNTVTTDPAASTIGIVTDTTANAGAITGNVITGGDLGIYLQGATEGFTVAGNTVTGTGNGNEGNGAVASDADGSVTIRDNVFDDNVGANLELFRPGATVSGNEFRDREGVQIADRADAYDEEDLVATNAFDRAVTAPAGVFTSVGGAVDSLDTAQQTVVVHPGDGSDYENDAVLDQAKTTLKGSEAASADSVRVVGTISVVANDVQVSSLRLAPGSTGSVETTSVFLQDVSGVQVLDNLFEGDGATAGSTERGIINAINGDPEIAAIRGNTFTGLTSGVFANPSAEFLIEDNHFEDNLAGSSNDGASEITDNVFVGNVEAVGLGAFAPTLIGNDFEDNGSHVCDYTPNENPLHVFQATNTYSDGPTKVEGDDPRCIVSGDPLPELPGSPLTGLIP